MSPDVALLRSSFNLVIEREPELTRVFYDILFERYPQARPLFRRNTPAMQQRMLAQALGAVVEHLEDGPWLVETLGKMGARHEAYGVTREMYGWVGDALLATLARAAGPDWTPDLAAAWAAAYGAITGLMQQGAAAKAA